MEKEYILRRPFLVRNRLLTISKFRDIDITITRIRNPRVNIII
jgi:hypothetical protein